MRIKKNKQFITDLAVNDIDSMNPDSRFNNTVVLTHIPSLYANCTFSKQFYFIDNKKVT